MSKNSLNWKIVGKAGEGIMVIARIMARYCQSLSWQVFNYYEYPSLIKGGHQTGQVHAGKKVTCHKTLLDVLIVLHQDLLSLHKAEISSNTFVIGDFANWPQFTEIKKDIPAQYLDIPLQKLAIETTGSKLSINAVAAGASLSLAGLELSAKNLSILIGQEFADKNQELQQSIIKAYQVGFAYAQKLVIENQAQLKNLKEPIHLPKECLSPSLLVTGSQAVGLGALAAGVQFYSAYPMTPASGLLHFLAGAQKKYPLVVKHAEDEIAAIHHAIGASVAGVRAMTGSAGGGFALMTEALSFSSGAEIPLVILVAQRPAPGTGLPTWTSQADLQFVLRSGHGDSERIVLTPGNVAEHFELAKQAFYLAEKYQMPVIILSDKYILESEQTMPTPTVKYKNQRYSIVTQGSKLSDYERYKVKDDGISLRALPGTIGGQSLTNSYEHGPLGYSTEEALIVNQQVEKRQKKLATAWADLPKPILYGPSQAEVTLVSWGSTINTLQPLIDLSEQKVNLVHLPCLWPFPKEEFLNLMKQTKISIMVEANVTGQAEQLIAQETGWKFTTNLRRYDGRPFSYEEVYQWLQQQKFITKLDLDQT